MVNGLPSAARAAPAATVSDSATPATPSPGRSLWLSMCCASLVDLLAGPRLRRRCGAVNPRPQTPSGALPQPRQVAAEAGPDALGEQPHRALVQLRPVPVLVGKEQGAERADIVDERPELVQH